MLLLFKWPTEILVWQCWILCIIMCCIICGKKGSGHIYDRINKCYSNRAKFAKTNLFCFYRISFYCKVEDYYLQHLQNSWLKNVTNLTWKKAGNGRMLYRSIIMQLDQHASGQRKNKTRLLTPLKPTTLILTEHTRILLVTIHLLLSSYLWIDAICQRGQTYSNLEPLIKTALSGAYCCICFSVSSLPAQTSISRSES